MTGLICFCLALRTRLRYINSTRQGPYRRCDGAPSDAPLRRLIFITVNQQLCRRLPLDRLPYNQQDPGDHRQRDGHLRESVTEAAGNPEKPGVLRHPREMVTSRSSTAVLNRLCCWCYAVVKGEGSAAASSRGRRTVNSLPSPRPALATDTLPPCNCTSWRTSASPIPRPARERGFASSACR